MRYPPNPVPGSATTIGISIQVPNQPKPSLTAATLLASGFAFSGRWALSTAGDLVLDRPFPKMAGVYAFVKDGVALYVGVATMSLAKRLYFYGKPGITQRTSQRINGIIKNELAMLPYIDIYTAKPPDFEWNGLPIHGSVGLELGLIIVTESALHGSTWMTVEMTRHLSESAIVRSIAEVACLRIKRRVIRALQQQRPNCQVPIQVSTALGKNCVYKFKVNSRSILKPTKIRWSSSYRLNLRNCCHTNVKPYGYNLPLANCGTSQMRTPVSRTQSSMRTSLTI